MIGVVVSFHDTRIKPDRKKRTHVRRLEALGLIRPGDTVECMVNWPGSAIA
ncbi:hypothetical protein [Nonomuraea sp. JJY05]|uniref:hypothetical protein n=1 Tax=Nonomuraea sp. JJY05 TaxID=3350255 RepID=UPI00374824C8